MREIKFRAFDNKNKKWLLGYEYPNLGGFSLFGEAILFGEWGNTFDKFLFEREGLTWNDLIVEQFTGLKDKNGKEIYEGDIIDIHQTVNGQNKFIIFSCIPTLDVRYEYDNTRKYEYDAYDLLRENEIFGDTEIEVIGNIHEPSPQLTK